MEKLINTLFGERLVLVNHLGLENERKTEVYEGKFNTKLKKNTRNTKNKNTNTNTNTLNTLIKSNKTIIGSTNLYNKDNHILEVIVKIIPRKEINNLNEMIIELGFLRYLSKYKSSQKYIQSCYLLKITKDYLIVVLEKPRGITLKNYLDNIIGLPFEKYYNLIIVIMYKLLIAINYIHEKKVAHRGVNPDTIYITYNQTDYNILELKLTDFSVACGNMVSLNSSNTNTENYNQNSNNKIYDKFCQTIDLKLSTNPPENIKIDDIIEKIKTLSRNIKREKIYLYLAQKADIWSLGVLFWKLFNRKTIDIHPLNIKFPDISHNSNQLNLTSDKYKYKGYTNLKDIKLVKALYDNVVKYMLSEIPLRYKSNQILEEFITINKYYEEDSENN